MKIPRLAMTACALTVAFALSACTATPAPTGTEAAPSPSTEPTFLNQSDVDIMERLPATVPDARIRYDESPLTYGDIRIPTDGESETYPLVVLIHGGAWESSYNSDYFDQLAEALADAGVATWNLEFRRLNNPGSEFPGMFLDIAHGVDFVRDLAERYPIDVDNVVVMGHSSGGHLAAWAAGRKNIPRDSELFAEDPLAVRGVVDLAGVLDLEHAFEAGRTDVLDVVGAADGQGLSAKAPATSPIRLLPLGVPQTLIIGTEDSPWRIESDQRYRAAGTAAGDDVKVVTLEGANHFDVVDVCSPAWVPIVTAVFEYVDLPLDDSATESPTAVCAR